ncbi:hypothetical protein PVV74_11560 [Roseovarius sp. SK2]|uniref:hypothetical protein n=1 Tax=Roseovarius TaxID=74030 RepID=UPI00237A1FAE|nr:hypothetical protein [Roseovarius sp. SK2]MDD9726093.1 hypothetical protein [Roseovarius sp. SK2]
MKGIESIAAERKRQIEQEGWTPEHDDTHVAGEMADAAACYARNSVDPEDCPKPIWPWSKDWWKPKTPREDLVRAGALIAAEIDRIDRRKDQPHDQ